MALFSWLQNRFSRKFLKTFAKTQLNAFYSFQQEYPNIPNEEEQLYQSFLMNRPLSNDGGRTEDVVNVLMNISRSLSYNSKIAPVPLKFRHVVCTLMLYEWLKVQKPFEERKTHLQNLDLTTAEILEETVQNPALVAAVFGKVFGEILNVASEIIPSNL